MATERLRSSGWLPAGGFLRDGEWRHLVVFSNPQAINNMAMGHNMVNVSLGSKFLNVKKKSGWKNHQFGWDSILYGPVNPPSPGLVILSEFSLPPFNP